MKNKFFKLAKAISIHSNHKQHKLGAVIVRKNKVISIGYNKMQTHPKSTHFYKFAHAEFCAIIKAQQDLTDCSIYIYRETKDGKPGMAKPCNSCMQLILEMGIKHVHYTNLETTESIIL